MNSDVRLENLNMPPLRTWRRLGVNGTELVWRAPEPESGGAGASLGTPRRFDAAVTLPDGAVTPDPGEFPDGFFTSAVGENAEAYTREQRNAGLCTGAPRGVELASPAAARYELNSGSFALFDCNLIVAQPDSRIEVVVTYISPDHIPAFHAGLTRVMARRGSSVRFVSVQMLGADAVHMTDFAAVAEDGARVEYVQIELGAAKTVSGCHIDLRGADSRASTDAFYFGSGSRSLDFNNIIRHSGERTHSEMSAGGALFDSAEKIYRGTLDFIRGSKKSAGSEKESTLLFSPDTRNRSAPLILCGEDDVDGRHAATVGKLDAAKLYYMLSRGLTQTQAKRLMTRSLLDSVMRSVPDAALRGEASQYLSERIN
jgi:Fe-S cluster assembly scaffold protein SufB